MLLFWITKVDSQHPNGTSQPPKTPAPGSPVHCSDSEDTRYMYTKVHLGKTPSQVCKNRIERWKHKCKTRALTFGLPRDAHIKSKKESSGGLAGEVTCHY